MHLHAGSPPDVEHLSSIIAIIVSCLLFETIKILEHPCRPCYSNRATLNILFPWHQRSVFYHDVNSSFVDCEKFIPYGTKFEMIF